LGQDLALSSVPWLHADGRTPAGRRTRRPGEATEKKVSVAFVGRFEKPAYETVGVAYGEMVSAGTAAKVRRWRQPTTPGGIPMTRTAPCAVALMFAASLAAGCSSKPSTSASGPVEPTKPEVKRGEAPKVDLGPGPDLQVLDVYLTKDGYMRARIKNGGTEPATKVRAAFFVNGKSESIYGTFTLKPGQEREAGASKLPPGMHVVKVVVDPDNTIRETDETNNAMEAKLTPPP
jgi:hypothetical protein